jgi:uncharacterized membrane protein YfcA
MPAWIQAVGSIAAILVSVGIIAWDHGRQREAQLDSEKAELANLVLATYMFGSAIGSVVHTFVSSEGPKGIAPMSTIDFCINRMFRGPRCYKAQPDAFRSTHRSRSSLKVLAVGSGTRASEIFSLYSTLANAMSSRIDGGIHDVSMEASAATASV